MHSIKYLVTGLERSGSTFIYQVAKHFAGVRKAHGYCQAFKDEAALICIRDPRDVVCSLAHAKQISYVDAFNELFNRRRRHEQLLMYQKAKNHHFIKYENYFMGHEPELVMLIASFIGKKISEKEACLIAQEHSIESNKQMSKQLPTFDCFDHETHIHGRHITNNGNIGIWKKCLTEDLILQINVLLDTFFSVFNYAKEMPNEKDIYYSCATAIACKPINGRDGCN